MNGANISPCIMHDLSGHHTSCRSSLAWNSQPAEVAHVLNAPVVSDTEKSTASLVLDKREPVVVKYSTKSSKKSGRKSTEEENEKMLVCLILNIVLYCIPCNTKLIMITCIVHQGHSKHGNCLGKQIHSHHIYIGLHLSVRPSVKGLCRPLPEIKLTLRRFLPVTVAWRLPVECCGKRQLSAVSRHSGKLCTCMEGE